MDQSEYIVTHIDWTKIDVWCCDKFFSSDEIDKHVEKVHEICQTKTVENETLKAEKKIYPCEICPKSFFNKSILEIHMKVHKKTNEGGKDPPKEDSFAYGGTKKARDAGKYSCYICDKTFKYSGDLSKHKRVHTKEKPYSCSFCGKTFSQTCNRNTHVQLKHSSLWNSNLQCAIEKPLFESDSPEKMGEMVQRSSVNQGDVQYQEHKEEGTTRPKRHRGKEVNVDKSRSIDVKCDAEKKAVEAFNSEKRLKVFKDQDSPEKVQTANRESVQPKWEKVFPAEKHSNFFPCSYKNCLKSFATKKGLKQHVFIHTAEKTFKCDKCTKVFARKWILKSHKRIHSGSLKPLQCDEPLVENVETLPEVREETTEEVLPEKSYNENSKLLNNLLPVETEGTSELIPAELRSRQVSRVQTASAGDEKSDVRVPGWRVIPQCEF